MRSHGLYIDSNGKKSRLYHIWEDMKSRCNNPKNRRYKDYGGRGIVVCDEWVKDYKAFYNWANANGYAENLTIDRDDVDGNYEPGNCKWSTQKEQGNNRRTNVIINYQGVSKTMKQWAEDKNMPYYVLRHRLKRGWSIERALNTLPEKHDKNAA